jgi:hypothetical protein
LKRAPREGLETAAVVYGAGGAPVLHPGGVCVCVCVCVSVSVCVCVCVCVCVIRRAHTRIHTHTHTYTHTHTHTHTLGEYDAALKSESVGSSGVAVVFGKQEQRPRLPEEVQVDAYSSSNHIVVKCSSKPGHMQNLDTHAYSSKI